MRPIIPIIAGPTAVGKTSTSLRVAKEMNAEIISADSRQIYRDFGIVTAAPTAAELASVPHHLIQEIDLSEPYSAGMFANRVEPIVEDLQNRNMGAVVTGGSTLYVHALIEGLSDIPKVKESIRLELNARLEREGPGEMYRELLQVDPTFAATLDATKSQRIIRGLEVFNGTGHPLSSFHAPPPLSNFDFRLFVLFRERSELYKRIDQRVDEMVREGLLEEVSRIYRENAQNDFNSLKTIGYQELVPHLKGEISLRDAIELMKRNSRRYAKRQLTWYGRYKSATWIDVDGTDAAANVISAIKT
ncbi:tRNA (adenosine(37)-N6)-dimethylallyltransferase MiaA [bacterium]|nr:tRNA (adenosine(37)-N6)-dimethylallyltransferase MiaA [bacterium]